MKWTELARAAVAKFPNSDIEVAIEFSRVAVPEFIGTSNDRIVKVGRSLKSLVSQFGDGEEEVLEKAISNLVEECELLMSDKLKVPTIRFGKTNIDMPIVTLGCMRFQQEWGPRITNMNMVGSDCQDNLLAILRQAISYGMVHIETARGYGCSELQLGSALKQLFLTDYCKREDLIIQTKIPPNKSIGEFRKAIETSFSNLQVDYIDLFSFHGMNFEEQLEWTFGGEENCLTVIQEYITKGKIKHLGFSTHGSTELILRVIEQDVFEYVNLHYHYFGSYTASGGGPDGMGNLNCVKLLEEKGMGIFIISPFDKGGRIYAPSQKLRRLTLPEMEPIEFKSQWVWNHHELYENDLPQLHTYTVGAGRPSDLDQPAVSAYRHAQKKESTVSGLRAIVARLDKAKEDALGKYWVENWWRGLLKAEQSKHYVEHNQIVWVYNMIQAYGLYEFARNRYRALENNLKQWDDSKTPEENIQNIGTNSWGFVPGLALRPDVDYSDDFANVPAENLERVRQAEEFVMKWCSTSEKHEKFADKMELERSRAHYLFRRSITVASQLFKMPSIRERTGSIKQRSSASSVKDDSESSFAQPEPSKVPEDWETAYDMRPWLDFPDRISRA